jgi:hypothetical protein
MPKATRSRCAPQVRRAATSPVPRSFVVRGAICAICDGPLAMTPGGFPACPRCGRVRLSVPAAPVADAAAGRKAVAR